MIRRLYIHNYRCFENFELSLDDMSSALLIGKNGAGKSTVGAVLEIFQQIGRGVNRVGQLVQEKDFAGGRTNVPIRFEAEVSIHDELYHYKLAFELPDRFKELRVLEEELMVAGQVVLSRNVADVNLSQNPTNGSQFSVDWHLVALPVIHESTEKAPVSTFRKWLASIVVLTPVPSLMTGTSKEASLEPKRDCSNFAEWFSGLLSQFPASYADIDRFLKGTMPDFHEVHNELVGKDFRNLVVQFKAKGRQLKIDFDELSDGEKLFFVCVVVLAANKYHGPLLCFWDEPDSHLSLTEVGHFVTYLRRSFLQGGQFLATSHHGETIRKFSANNTLLLYKSNHLEPTQIKALEHFDLKQDVEEALLLDELPL